VRRKKKLDALIKQEEGEANNYRGWLAVLLTLVAVGMSLFSFVCGLLDRPDAIP